jgi:Mitochondrial carrier protein
MKDGISWIIEANRRRKAQVEKPILDTPSAKPAIFKHSKSNNGERQLSSDGVNEVKEVTDVHQSRHPGDTSKRNSTLKKLFNGAFIGFSEISIGHPLWVTKTRIQQNYPLSIHPKILYKGFSVNACNEMLIATSQIYVSMSIEEILVSQNVNSITRKIVSGLIGGGISTLITTPAELVMTIQHRDNVSSVRVVENIISKYGVKRLFVGGIGTAFRESFFVAGYYSIVPLLKPVFIHRLNTGDLGAALLSGVVAGGTSAILSQPWDTIKTEQQARVDKENQRFFHNMYRVYQSNGLKGFFSGTVARSARAITATTIMGNLLDKLNTHDSIQKDANNYYSLK